MDKKKTNYWKWAFIILVLLIIVTCGTILVKATAPAPQAEMTQTTKANNSSLVVELNRKQVNALSANYLDNYLKDNKIKYNFMVGDKYATLVGDTKF